MLSSVSAKLGVVDFETVSCNVALLFSSLTFKCESVSDSPVKLFDGLYFGKTYKLPAGFRDWIKKFAYPEKDAVIRTLDGRIFKVKVMNLAGDYFL
ncbi:hypothetical protein Hanom_Chr04g00326541 [Helianthus anomalus]